MVWMLGSLLLLAGVMQAPLVHGWSQLTKGAFDGDLAANEYTLVAFVRPAEEKTKIFGPEWTNAYAKKIEHLIGVNCETAVDICESYDIQAYPDIRLFRRNLQIAVYQGPKRAAALLQFIGRLRRPVVSNLASADDAVAFKTRDETVFIAYLNSADGAEAKAFAGVAEKYREEFSFGVVVDPAVAAAEKAKSPSVVCYKVADADTVHLASFDEPEKLEGWAKEAARPVIGELTSQNQQRLLDRGWPMVYVFAQTQTERDELRKKLYRFASSQYETLTAVTVDPLEFPDLMPRLGLEPGVFPAGAVHQLSKDRVYPYPKGAPIDSNALQKWGLDVYQGKIKPWTPPGVTTTYDDLGPTKYASRKIDIKNIPGVSIKIAGRDEL